MAAACGAVATALVACSPSVPQPEPPEPEPPCPTGQLLDETGDEAVCVPEACGIGPWGDEADADLFVAAGADDGDGSQERPFGSVQEAADAMGSAGGVVAIDGGRYVENLALDDAHDGVVLAGRCAELVTIDGSGAEEPGIEVVGGSLEVRGLTVTGGLLGIKVRRVGWHLEPISLVVRSSALEGNRDVGLAVAGVGVAVEVVGITIRETATDADGTGGRGVEVNDGAWLDATDLLLEGNHDGGLFASNPGTTVVLSDAVVRDTRTEADGTGGRGVTVQNGASLDATDLLLEGNTGVGLFAAALGTTVTLADAVVRDTQPGFKVGGGTGLTVQDHAQVDALRLEVLRSTGPGAFLHRGGLQCEDCTFEDNGFGGLVVVEDSRVNLSGGSILSSQPTPVAGGGGVGLLAWNPLGLAPTAHLDGVTLSGHSGPALYFRGPGTYEVRDCVVEDSAFASGVFDVPSAIIAVQGVGAWDPTAGPFEPMGLLLADNTFSSLPTNAILLDGSAATLDSNLFEDVSGTDLYTQRCSEAPSAVELLGLPPSTNDCAGPTLLLEPLLQWTPVILEIEAIE